MRVSRRLSAWAIVVVVAGGCSSGGDTGSNASATPPGVALLVVPDLDGEPADVQFAAAPDLLVTIDGRVITAARPESAATGALMVSIWVQTITPAGIAVVVDAQAKGEAPSDLDSLLALVGDDLGAPEIFLPDTYRFAATQIGSIGGFDDSDSPVLTWPDGASVRLADATKCTILPELEVGEVFETAAEDSVFIDDGIVYGVVAAPDWPGAPC